MKTSFKIIAVGIIAVFAYLLLWPVAISPQAWDAPTNAGYVGTFAPNTKLQDLEYLSIGDTHGPEDVVARIEGADWTLYVSSQSGDILRIKPGLNTREIVTNTGGVPLGLALDATGNLIIADAHKGLLSMTPSGEISVLTNTVDGTPINYADELDIASDGKIYFSDASTKFGAKDNGTTLNASLLELMEHGKTGRVLVYDPADQSTRTLVDNLSFSNGIAMCPDQDCIMIVETGTYSIQKYWLLGPKAGSLETIIDNLPGFPDNLDRGQVGRYWFGLTSPRSEALDKLSNKPFLRKVVQRLPAAMRPKATHYGLVAAIDDNGTLLTQYQDPKGSYPLTTGAIEPGDGYLYITSLSATRLARKKLKD